MSIQNTKNLHQIILDRKWPRVLSDFLWKFILFANGVYGLGMPIANTSKSNNNASHDFSKGFHNWLVCLFRDVWRRPKVQVVRGWQQHSGGENSGEEWNLRPAQAAAGADKPRILRFIIKPTFFPSSAGATYSPAGRCIFDALQRCSKYGKFTSF